MTLADLHFESRGRAVVAHLSGEVDLSNVETIRSALTEAMQNHMLALVLDLTEVDYLDSAGIQLIYRLRGDLAARAQALRLVIPAGSAANAALRLAGVAGHVETSDTLDAALDGFSE